MDSIFVGEQGWFIQIVFWSVVSILAVQFSFLVADIIRDARKNHANRFDEISS